LASSISNISIQQLEEFRDGNNPSLLKAHQYTKHLPQFEPLTNGGGALPDSGNCLKAILLAHTGFAYLLLRTKE
jgi:hypothetical protein